MKRSLAMVALSGVLLGTLWGSAPASTASTAKQDVRVVNTTAEAVPVNVQGTATVSGGVQVTNTPTVGLDPSQNGVQIVNSQTAPVPVRVNSALTHVGVPANDIVTLQSRAGDFATTEIHSDGSSFLLGSVPEGKALVITDVEWVGVGNAGDAAGFLIAQHGQNGSITVFDVVDKLDTNGFASRTTSMATGITFGPGTQLSFGFIGGVIGASRIHAHGYYVDAP